MEGCLSVNFQKIGDIKVDVQKIDECCSNVEFEKVKGIYNLELNKISSNTKINTHNYNKLLDIKSNKIGKIELSTKETPSITNINVSRKYSKLNVTCGLICQVSIGDDGEPMWWCNEWRVLWNNGIATLWRK